MSQIVIASPGDFGPPSMHVRADLSGPMAYVHADASSSPAADPPPPPGPASAHLALNSSTVVATVPAAAPGTGAALVAPVPVAVNLVLPQLALRTNGAADAEMLRTFGLEPPRGVLPIASGTSGNLGAITDVTAAPVPGMSPGQTEAGAGTPGVTTAARALPADGMALSEEELTPTRGADLVASFSPFDRAAVERAFDHLLGRLGELTVELPSLSEPSNVVPGALAAVALALSVADVVRRRVQRAWDEEPVLAGADDARHTGLPGPPGRWDSEDA